MAQQNSVVVDGTSFGTCYDDSALCLTRMVLKIKIMRHPLQEILARAFPVMPVLAVEQVEDALPLANALKAGGLTVLEVTLRTDAALQVIAAMKKVEGVTVGAGTVTHANQFRDLEEVGADFAISPGATPQLLEAGRLAAMPFL
ncbi:MAG: hypothetical protein WED11_10425, partial [Natronospirillum sp.]